MKNTKFGYLFLSMFLLPFSGVATAQNSSSCAALNSFSYQGARLEITQTSWKEAGTLPGGPFAPPVTVPTHCHVEAALDRRIGVNGKEYFIGFAINLPENWNGRFLFQGGGGLNGSVEEPLGNQATGAVSALEKGFAVVTSDSGHQGGVFDGSFMEDQEALLNFYFLGKARVTPIAKQITTEFYQQEISSSYFVGCSTGGREGMIMSQRFPYYFDGIVSGAPAMRTGLSNLGIRWVAIELNKAAEKDEAGLPVQGGTFSVVEQDFIVSKVLESCDVLDGAEDGLIFNSLSCSINTKDMMCENDNAEGCLNEDKAVALQSAFSGPVDSQGRRVYSSYFFDTGIDDSGFISGLINGNNNPPVGAPVNTVLEQDVDAEFLAAIATDQSLGDSTSFNLSSFAGQGGKIMYYHGVSDPWFSAQDTRWYYEQMATNNGGLEAVNDWSKFYLVPGMGHCAGGEATLDTFDMLTALVDWVENDQAPEQVVATGLSMPEVSRPLCAYPYHAHYTGSGDIKNAGNFECKAD